MLKIGQFPGDSDEGDDFAWHDGYIDEGDAAESTTDPDDD